VGEKRMRIEVIEVEPPCKKCKALLENARRAVEEAGLKAEVVKINALSEKAFQKYGLLLVPALDIDGVVVSQGKVLRAGQIAKLLGGKAR